MTNNSIHETVLTFRLTLYREQTAQVVYVVRIIISVFLIFLLFIQKKSKISPKPCVITHAIFEKKRENQLKEK
jgi:hypothetical protein